jgi:SAM-dependent methyltransferase
MATDFWEENAEQWAKVMESRTIASRTVTNPAILNTVLECKPRSVLDLGCGDGWLAPEFQSRNIQYLGFDGSARLVEIARAKYGPHFEHHSYEDLEKQEVKPVDVAILNYSLMGEELLPIFHTIKSFLNPKGSIVIQTLHPCFAVKPYKDGWQNEDFKSLSASGAQALAFQGTMPWYGRTLSSWITLFNESGLCLEKMIEPAGADGPVSIIFVLSSG